MAFQLENNITAIRVIENGNIKDIIKTNILQITLIKTNIVKIDIGQGALRNVFIPYFQVTDPATGSPQVLLNTLTDWLYYDGRPNEERQVALTNAIQGLGGVLNNSYQQLVQLNDRLLKEPLVVEDRGNGVVYKGYSVPGVLFNEEYWVIQKIETIGIVTTIKYADGVTVPGRRWDQREHYDYY